MQSSRDRVLTDGKPVYLQKAGGSPTSDPAEGEFLRRCKLNTNSYPPEGGRRGGSACRKPTSRALGSPGCEASMSRLPIYVRAYK